MIHRLRKAETTRWWEDEPPGIDPKRVPPRARSRVKKAEALLRRFGVWPQRKFERSEWVEFDGRSLLEGILRNQRDIHRIYSGEVSRILVGPDVMEELCCEMHERERLSPFSFHERVPLHGPFGSKVFGLEVQYVPWMRGILLAPESEVRVDSRTRLVNGRGL